MTDLIANLHRDNLHYWQESIAVDRLATPNQQELWSRGVLPDATLLDLARTELFRGFSSFVKRRRLDVWHIPHPRDANGLWTCAWPGGGVSSLHTNWQTSEADPTTLEWMTLLRIQQATYALTEHPWLSRTPDPVTVKVREHRGTCTVCSRSVADRAALVTIRWAGRTLSREYSL